MSALERGPEFAFDLGEALMHRVWLRNGHTIRPCLAANLANCHGNSITSEYH